MFKILDSKSGSKKRKKNCWKIHKTFSIFEKISLLFSWSPPLLRWRKENAYLLGRRRTKLKHNSSDNSMQSLGNFTFPQHATNTFEWIVILTDKSLFHLIRHHTTYIEKNYAVNKISLNNNLLIYKNSSSFSSQKLQYRLNYKTKITKSDSIVIHQKYQIK